MSVDVYAAFVIKTVVLNFWNILYIFQRFQRYTCIWLKYQRNR